MESGISADIVSRDQILFFKPIAQARKIGIFTRNILIDLSVTKQTILHKFTCYIFSVLVLIGIVAIIPGCNRDNAFQEENGPTIERIKKNEVLVVGTTGDYHPLTFLEQDGSYSGFGIEIAEVIAKELGVGIRFVQTSWPTLTADVLDDPQKFDFAIGGITITDKRLETMLMSDGYLANGKTILCRQTDANKFKSLEDIDKPEVKVMVNPGGTNELLAKEKLTNSTIIVHQNNLEIPHLIAEGVADIMITEITEAPYYTSIDERLAAPLIDKPFTKGFIGVLMRKGQEDLMKTVNKVIERMKKDGSLKKLHEKYGLVYSFE